MDEDEQAGRIIYRGVRRTAGGATLELVFAISGRGQERAAARTAVLVSKLRPAIVVNIGIAGSLSPDAWVGDMVVGEQIFGYLANGRAVPSTRDGFGLRTGAEVFRSDELLVERARLLPVTAPAGLARWRHRMRADVDPRLVAAIGTPRLAVHVGALASGPIVSASDGFRQWLRRQQRDYLAIEMEAAGIAQAVRTTAMPRPARYLVLRGIADMADGNKTALEAGSGGAARRFAVRGAFELLLVLLDNLPMTAFD